VLRGDRLEHVVAAPHLELEDHAGGEVVGSEPDAVATLFSARLQWRRTHERAPFDR